MEANEKKMLGVIGVVTIAVIAAVAVVLLIAVLVNDDSPQPVTIPVAVPVAATVTTAIPGPCDAWPLKPECIPPGYTVITPNGTHITSTSPPAVAP
jgi:hypothetical protein